MTSITTPYGAVNPEPADIKDLAMFWARMPAGATDALSNAGACRLARAYLDALDVINMHQSAERRRKVADDYAVQNQMSALLNFVEGQPQELRGPGHGVWDALLKRLQEIDLQFAPSAIRPSTEEAIVNAIRHIGVKAGVAATVYGEMCHEIRTILGSTDSTALQEEFKRRIAASEEDLKAKLKPYEDGQKASDALDIGSSSTSAKS